jgi:phosphatidylserine decarboxylase
MGVMTFAAAQLLRVLPRNAISRAMGALCEAEVPAPLMRGIVAAYSKAYGVAAEEACPSGLPYTSFDAFFTRKLREGARVIEGDERTLVAPADGKIVDLGSADLHGSLQVKGKPYTLEELIGDAGWARELAGGGFCVVYLSPRDYHRVHSPISGKIVRVRAIDGDRYPVNAIGEEHVPQLFVKNRRVVVEVQSPVFGRCAVVLVGAMIVGRMTVVGIDQPDVQGEHRPSPPIELARGDELGRFHLGSTVVLAIPKDRFGGFVRSTGEVSYGQSLAIAKDGARGGNGSRTGSAS